MNNLRKFNWITQYNSAKEGEELVKPSVAVVNDKAVVIYDDDIHIQYRWINLDPEVDYICDTSTFTKYYKQKKQQSNDGYTWTDVVPAEYRRGDVYQTKSRDCGYMPKLYSTYSDGREYELLCNSSSMLTVNEVKPSGYDYTKMTSASIGQCVNAIGDSAFRFCSSLTSVIIPDTVTTIDNDTFAYCNSLTSIDIPSGVTSIGSYAFSECTSLTSVTIPDSVTSIGGFAFQNCTSLTSAIIGCNTSFANFNNCTSLTSITFGSGVTSIGESCFNKCKNVTTITSYAITPPELGRRCFNDQRYTVQVLYVPAESVNAYKTAWTMFRNVIQAIP